MKRGWPPSGGHFFCVESKNKQQQSKSEMRGFFAPLRMTSSLVRMTEWQVINQDDKVFKRLRDSLNV